MTLRYLLAAVALFVACSISESIARDEGVPFSSHRVARHVALLVCLGLLATTP